MRDRARRYWEELFAAMEGERSARSSEWLRPHLEALARTGPRLLDLGCGTGDDVRILAREGFWPVGLDFAANAVFFARDMYRRGHFAQADMTGKHLPFRDGSFDGVIARCSLHYFTTAQTRRIVDEVARVLVPGGSFAFVVNSAAFLKTRERYDYARAKTLEPRTVRFTDGVTRHFFLQSELRRMLRGSFAVEVMTEGEFRQYEERRIAWTVRARRKEGASKRAAITSRRSASRRAARSARSLSR